MNHKARFQDGRECARVYYDATSDTSNIVHSRDPRGWKVSPVAANNSNAQHNALTTLSRIIVTSLSRIFLSEPSYTRVPPNDIERSTARTHLTSFIGCNCYVSKPTIPVPDRFPLRPAADRDA